MKVNQLLPQKNHHLAAQKLTYGPGVDPVLSCKQDRVVCETHSMQVEAYQCQFNMEQCVCEDKPFSSTNTSLLETMDVLL